MLEIKVQKLTDDAFRKYGFYQDMTNNKQMSERALLSDGKGEGGFYGDLVWLDFGRAGNIPTASVCHVKKAEKRIVRFLEYHQTTCEGLFPFDDDVVIYVGTPGRAELNVRLLEAFYVPRGTFVKLNPLVVHGGQYPVHNEEAHVLCLLPGRTGKADMISRLITDEDEMAELML